MKAEDLHSGDIVELKDGQEVMLIEYGNFYGVTRWQAKVLTVTNNEDIIYPTGAQIMKVVRPYPGSSHWD